MGEMCTEATRVADPHLDVIQATMRKVVDLLDSLPDNINIETHIEITFDVTEGS